MPTLDEIQRKKNVQLVDLPKTFIGTIISEAMRKDPRDKECLYWEIVLADNKGSFTQKLSRGYYGLLENCMQLLGVNDTSDLLNKKAKFEQTTLGVLQSNPRWFPIEFL